MLDRSKIPTNDDALDQDGVGPLDLEPVAMDDGAPRAAEASQMEGSIGCGPRLREDNALSQPVGPPQPVGDSELAQGVGSGRVTLSHIAAKAGVSRSTVSLVLRESPLVAADTRARVQEAITALGYIYNRHAANLRSGSSCTAGLVVCEITNPFYAEFTAGVDSVLDEAGFVAFMANTNEHLGRQRRFLTRMREQGVDGVIISPAAGTESAFLAEASSANLPCVMALRRIDGYDGDYVGPDYRFAMELATEHLIKLGHTRIAFIGGPQRISPLRERKAGYRAALRRHGLAPHAIVPCLNARADGASAIQGLLDGSSVPTAAVCYNDVVAQGVMLGLAERGLKAGVDFAVIGCDDIAEAALCRPALSTTSTNPRAIGEEAARLLLRRIENPHRAPEEVILPPRLIIRESCGARMAAQRAGRRVPPVDDRSGIAAP